MAAKKAATVADRSPAKQLDSFLAKFAPERCKIIKTARRQLRKRMPTAYELVYDNYNALAIGFCSSERTSSCIISLAAGSGGVNLYFYYGATLPDPRGILLGSGNQGRFIRLTGVETFALPGVEALIKAAIKQADPPLPKAGNGALIIKSISAKQRPRQNKARK